MRYRSVALSAAALALAPISSADAQSVYVAPGGVYVASGNVYVAPPPPAPYGPPVPGVGGPAAVYTAPPYGPPPVSVYAAPPPAYGPPPVSAYAAVPPAYGAPATVYAAPSPGYVVRERILAPTDAYAAEYPPRPPAPIPYGGRPRW
jgi:hypothetical protein